MRYALRPLRSIQEEFAWRQERNFPFDWLCKTEQEFADARRPQARMGFHVHAGEPPDRDERARRDNALAAFTRHGFPGRRLEGDGCGRADLDHLFRHGPQRGVRAEQDHR